MSVKTALVRGGEDYFIPNGHTRLSVYAHMLLQIMRDYKGLPDTRTLTSGEIRFLYEGLRGEIKEATRPKN